MRRILLTICTLYLSNTALSQPFLDAPELSLDEMNYIGGKMHNVFTNIYIGIEQNIYSDVLSEPDKEKIRQAVTSSPQSIAGIDYLEAGCEYFYATKADQLSTTKLAGYFVKGDKEGVKVKYRFMIEQYRGLSEKARNLIDTTGARFDGDTGPWAPGTDNIPSVDESLQHYYRLSRDYLIERYSDFCDGGLDDVRRSLQNPEKVFGYTTIGNPQ